MQFSDKWDKSWNESLEMEDSYVSQKIIIEDNFNEIDVICK